MASDAFTNANQRRGILHYVIDSNYRVNVDEKLRTLGIKGEYVNTLDGQTACPGHLYIVPTPIGNLSDISQRALSILASVDWVAAEDTRHSQRLFQHFGLQVKTLSLHDHNEDKRVKLLTEKLIHKQSIALVSDAGTPLISDPGYSLVRTCRHLSIPVIALPGPCAAITALSASGLPTNKFAFLGFLPVKKVALEKAIHELVESPFTNVVYEAPRRIKQTIKTMSEILPADQTIVLAKEISKTFETYIQGSAHDVLEWLQQSSNHERGEFVVMISSALTGDDEIPPEATSLLKLLLPTMPPKKAAGIVAEHYGVKKNKLYAISLRLS